MLGERLGQYQVTGKLGEGGMGAVYLARHTLIGRPAAIKVLKAEYSHRPDVVERFFNEARAASAIRHPGIVEIYDFGYHVDDSAYIVMEHLEGESLETRLRRLSRLPIDRALNLVRQVASGLAAAQDQEIIHRDLKPDNIFVVPDPDIPGGERTKILDFGIAKLATQGGPGSYKTSTGTVMGTPAYMAPEQCKGAGHVDRRADLYALGCILFEMLCGRPPFVAEGGGEVMAQHIYASPPSPLAFDPAIPAEVDALILRLLAKEPDRRFQSAREVIAAIDAIAQRPSPSVPVAAIPPAGAETSPAPPRVAAPTAKPETTLGAAAGSVPPTARRRSRATYFAPALAAVVLAGGGVIFALTRGGGDERAGESAGGAAGDEPLAATAADAGESTSPSVEPVASTTPMPDATTPAVSGDVAIVIDSEPRGADVYQQPLGVRVGTTPVTVKHPVAEGELVFVLKKNGYRTKQIVVPANQSRELTVELPRRVTAAKKPGDRAGGGDDAATKPSTSGGTASNQPPTSGSGKSDKPPASGSVAGKGPADGQSSSEGGPDRGKSLNPFEKKQQRKEPKKGKGRNLNPFDK